MVSHPNSRSALRPKVRSIVLSVIAIGLSLTSRSAMTEGPGKKSAFANGPRTVASRDRVSVLIDRETSGGKSLIVLKISVPTDSKVNAFLLPDPPRVVVDFEGASIKKSENFLAPENGVIKQIRLGAHPEKLRVVVDLIKTTPPEYEWKAGKRQAIITFVEGAAAEGAAASTAPAPTQPTAAAPTQPPQQPTQPAAKSAVPTQGTPASTPATLAPTLTATFTPTYTAAPTLSDVAPKDKQAEPKTVAQLPAGVEAADSAKNDLGDLEQGPAPTKVPTTFSIKGYKFEYLPDKSPVLKIQLNKPRAEAQISKVDAETYKIDIKDCGVENEDLELPQFPPHDFVGFVMVVSEVVGKNVEVSVSVEENVVLGTSIHENEIWVKKP